MTALERDPELAARAHGRCKEVVVADLESAPPLLHGPFDAIVYGDVLEHVSDPAAVLRALDETLAPGGTVIVSVPNVAHLWVRLSAPRRPLRLRGPRHPRPHPPPLLHAAHLPRPPALGGAPRGRARGHAGAASARGAAALARAPALGRARAQRGGRAGLAGRARLPVRRDLPRGERLDARAVLEGRSEGRGRDARVQRGPHASHDLRGAAEGHRQPGHPGGRRLDRRHPRGRARARARDLRARPQLRLRRQPEDLLHRGAARRAPTSW